MANTNESFIDEVAEAVRRDRINLWLRRWGWILGLLVLAIVVGAGAWEWRTSRADAAAEARGDALLGALEIRTPADRLAALQALPKEGGTGVLTDLLIAGDQQAAGDPAAAAQTLAALGADGAASPLYRDLAAFKALLAQGASADPAGYEALAAPGAPFRLLALEQMALLDLGKGDRDAAVARLQSIREDADVQPSQRGRVEALLTALGAPPADEPAAPAAPAPAPTGE